MRAILGLTLALLSSQASAQVLYKCVGARGAVSYQSEPCDADQRLDKVYDATPERDDPYREAERRRTASEIAAGARAWSRMAGTDRLASASGGWRVPGAPNGAHEKCNAAKQHREQTLKATGLRRTFDLLRQLDEYVRQECKAAGGP